MRARRFGYVLVVVAVGVAVGFAGRVAWAAIPDVNTIHGCYKNDTGELRVIDPSAGGACNSKSETALDWSQTGQQGGAGVQGLRGAQGPTGADGPDGVVDYQVVSDTETTVANTDYKTGLATAIAACPAGTAATGEGFNLPSTKISIWDEHGGVAIENNAGLTVTGATGVTFTAYTVCVGDEIEGK